MTINKKYKLGKKIGSGSFGDVYLATNIINDEQVAVKIERMKSIYEPQLHREAETIRDLAGGRKISFICLIPDGIPWVRWFGVEKEYKCMVMDLLGPTLEDLFNYCKRKFTAGTILQLANQLVII